MKGSGARDRAGGTFSKWQNCWDTHPGRESVPLPRSPPESGRCRALTSGGSDSAWPGSRVTANPSPLTEAAPGEWRTGQANRHIKQSAARQLVWQFTQAGPQGSASSPGKFSWWLLLTQLGEIWLWSPLS